MSRGRNHYLKAYARLVRSLFAALTLAFLLSFPAARRMARTIELPPEINVLGGALGVAGRFFAIDFVAPLYVAFPEFLLSRLTSELIAGVLVCGLAIALVLEAYERY
ncbi:hypothetical protein [Halomicrobium urmianum]|uniref:hypothetical protein n=1 Tax=Halomicrobium urmianum TaxID=1586233 RepID=UPI001CDA2CC5|nr:hypothetical protein [Halomicrobium urmianum]